MPLQRRKCAKLRQDGFRKVAAKRQAGIQNWTRVALGEDETVTIRISRFPGIDPENVEVQRGHKIGRRERSAGMARLRLVDHVNDMEAHLACDSLQLLNSLIKRIHAMLHECSDVRPKKQSLVQRNITLATTFLSLLL
jgi:hypothetical protein